MRHGRRPEKEFAVWSLDATVLPVVHGAKPLGLGGWTEAKHRSVSHLNSVFKTLDRQGATGRGSQGALLLEAGIAPYRATAEA